MYVVTQICWFQWPSFLISQCLFKVCWQ